MLRRNPSHRKPAPIYIPSPPVSPLIASPEPQAALLQTLNNGGHLGPGLHSQSHHYPNSQLNSHSKSFPYGHLHPHSRSHSQPQLISAGGANFELVTTPGTFSVTRTKAFSLSTATVFTTASAATGSTAVHSSSPPSSAIPTTGANTPTTAQSMYSAYGASGFGSPFALTPTTTGYSNPNSAASSPRRRETHWPNPLERRTAPRSSDEDFLPDLPSNWRENILKLTGPNGYATRSESVLGGYEDHMSYSRCTSAMGHARSVLDEDADQRPHPYHRRGQEDSEQRVDYDARPNRSYMSRSGSREVPRSRSPVPVYASKQAHFYDDAQTQSESEHDVSPPFFSIHSPGMQLLTFGCFDLIEQASYLNFYLSSLTSAGAEGHGRGLSKRPSSSSRNSARKRNRTFQVYRPPTPPLPAHHHLSSSGQVREEPNDVDQNMTNDEVRLFLVSLRLRSSNEFFKILSGSVNNSKTSLFSSHVSARDHLS